MFSWIRKITNSDNEKSLSPIKSNVEKQKISNYFVCIDLNTYPKHKKSIELLLAERQISGTLSFNFESEGTNLRRVSGYDPNDKHRKTGKHKLQIDVDIDELTGKLYFKKFDGESLIDIKSVPCANLGLDTQTFADDLVLLIDAFIKGELQHLVEKYKNSTDIAKALLGQPLDVDLGNHLISNEK